MCAGFAEKIIPAVRRISARRGEAEAKMSISAHDNRLMANVGGLHSFCNFYEKSET
jgi:hypothetical protein